MYKAKDQGRNNAQFCSAEMNAKALQRLTLENKLRNGDLQGAALEWNGLPEAARTASTDYKKSLDARIEVENLVGGTLNRAITSTGKQG